MFKTCPRCGDEFLPHIAECPDCRMPLQISEGGLAPAHEIASPGEAEAPSFTDAVLLRRDQPTELRQLAEALATAGIACAVDTDPPGEGIRGGQPISRGRMSGQAPQLAVYVSASDAKAAAAVHTQWLAQSIPGAELAGGLVEGACSGCNEPLPEEAVECPSCGLAILPLEVTCPGCGQPVAVEAESCARCGYRP